jgi:hypothetical protein
MFSSIHPWTAVAPAHGDKIVPKRLAHKKDVMCQLFLQYNEYSKWLDWY